jgi:hypothetical protein
MASLDVAELVGGQGEQLPPAQLFERRVPDHDPLGRAHAVELRVQRPGPAARVPDLDVDLPHPLLAGERPDLGDELLVAQRLESRGEQERLCQQEDGTDEHEHRAADEPPAFAQSPREQHEERNRRCGHREAADPFEPRVDEDRPVVGVGDVVAAAPPVGRQDERQSREPDDDERARAEGDTTADPAQPNARSEPNEKDQHRDLHERRDSPIRAQETLVPVASLEVRP